MILKKIEQLCKNWISYEENSSVYLDSVDITNILEAQIVDFKTVISPLLFGRFLQYFQMLFMFDDSSCIFIFDEFGSYFAH